MFKVVSCMSVIILLAGGVFADPAVEVQLTTRPSTPTKKIAVPDDYVGIRTWIGPNPASGLSPWDFTVEHLFVEHKYGEFGSDEGLRARCYRFVRSAGGLDFLFQKIIDPSTSDDEIIAITEILTFWTTYDDPTDETVKSVKAQAVLAAIDNGRLDSVEKANPDIHFSYYVRLAAKKAKPTQNATTEPSTRPAIQQGNRKGDTHALSQPP